MTKIQSHNRYKQADMWRENFKNKYNKIMRVTGENKIETKQYIKSGYLLLGHYGFFHVRLKFYAASNPFVS